MSKIPEWLAKAPRYKVNTPYNIVRCDEPTLLEAPDGWLVRLVDVVTSWDAATEDGWGYRRAEAAEAARDALERERDIWRAGCETKRCPNCGCDYMTGKEIREWKDATVPDAQPQSDLTALRAAVAAWKATDYSLHEDHDPELQPVLDAALALCGEKKVAND